MADQRARRTSRVLVLVLQLGLLVGLMQFMACGGEVSVSYPGCEDCPERCLKTSAEKGKCVACIKDEQCQDKSTSPTKKCLENKCVCGSNADCAQDQVCGPSDKGQAGCVECTKDDDCKDPGRSVCQYNECVTCRPGQEEKCAPDGVTACKQGIRKCKSNGRWDTCEGWTECKDGQKCVENACVADCPDPPPCKEENNTCTSKPDELPGKYKACKKNAKGCFELTDKTCGAKEFCDRGSCLPFNCPKAECTLDETRCVNESKFRTCVKDANGCLVWDDGKDCEKDTKCRLSTNRCTVCNPGDKQVCYDGDPATKNSGICRPGEQKCADDGSKWGDCKDQVIPQPETCDGKDNDCNGKIDDNITPKPCANQNGSCKGAVQRCDGAKGWAKCEASDYKKVFKEYEDKESLCDGIDNDCDGQIDNNLPGAPACDKSVGVCKGATKKCDGKNGWLACTDKDYKAHNPSYDPNAETQCDNNDNNCNGQIDENLKRDCYTGSSGCVKTSLAYNCKGICKPGSQTCSNGKWGSCVGDGTPQAEVCNGKDDNCDGAVDDGDPGGGASCIDNAKKGECRQGRLTCSGGRLVCRSVVTARTEISCNGKDDDCDGSVDEKKCASGYKCSGGRCVRCSAEIACNRIDDDCDGRLDEVSCAIGSACDGTVCKSCKQPEAKCQGYSVACVSDAPSVSCQCGFVSYCKEPSANPLCRWGRCCAKRACRAP